MDNECVYVVFQEDIHYSNNQDVEIKEIFKTKESAIAYLINKGYITINYDYFYNVDEHTSMYIKQYPLQDFR